MRPSLRLRRLALQEVGLRAGLAVNPASPRQPRWQTALTGRDSAQRSALRLVLAESGNVERVELPANAAVLIDALTGELLVHQRKVHPFNFSPADVELWGLGGRFEALIDEDLSRGERLCVIKAGGVRLVILVCEDLARLHAFSAAARTAADCWSQESCSLGQIGVAISAGAGLIVSAQHKSDIGEAGVGG